MTLVLRNRQRTRATDLRLLRQITLFLLKEILSEPQFELGIHLVGADEMATLNETFLQHHGSPRRLRLPDFPRRSRHGVVASI